MSRSRFFGAVIASLWGGACALRADQTLVGSSSAHPRQLLDGTASARPVLGLVVRWLRNPPVLSRPCDEVALASTGPAEGERSESGVPLGRPEWVAPIERARIASTSAMAGVLMAVGLGCTPPALAQQELALQGQWVGVPIERVWEVPTTNRELQSAMVVARLVRGELLPPGTRVDSPVSAETRAVVDAENYGELVQRLGKDVDGDGQLELDPFRLARVLDTDAQGLTRALSAPLASYREIHDRGDVIREELAKVGFDATGLDDATLDRALKSPRDLGLEGRTRMQRYQQQVYLRFGAILEDLNQNGELDPEDRLHSVDEAGRPSTQLFGSLPEVYRGLIELNQAIVETVIEYEEHQAFGVGFSGVHSWEGRSTERVNSEIWDLVRPRAGSDATWIMRPGVRPSEAIRDALFENSSEYTTDCAQMRTVIGLGGLLHYETSRLGEEAGRYAFDARFATSQAERDAARTYIQAFAQARKKDPSVDWSSYSQSAPPPELNLAFAINRHHIYRGAVDKTVGALSVSLAMEPWHLSESLPKGPGDEGYIANIDATIAAARLGYIGENVVHIGYVDGAETAWGHPIGLMPLTSWEAAIGAKGRTQSMDAFLQSFDAAPYVQWIKRDTGETIERFERRIEGLERDHPDGWERSLEVAKRYLAMSQAEQEVRLAVARDLDARWAPELKKFFDEAQIGQTVEQALPLVRGMTPDGLAKLVGAYALLEPHFHANEIAAQLPKGHSGELSNEERAALAINFSIAELGFMPLEFRGEGGELVDIAEFNSQSDLLRTSWGKEKSGGMGSRQAFAEWLPTEDFEQWYLSRTGAAYTGPRQIEAMTLEDVHHLIVTAFPAADWKRTVYGEVNGTNDKLSDQMARVLYTGGVRGAVYQPAKGTRAPAE